MNELGRTDKIPQKQNISLPLIPKNYSLCLRKQKYYIKPKLSRILYAPITSTTQKTQKQTHILQAFTNKKTYEEILDQMKEKEIQKYLRETKVRLNQKEPLTNRSNVPPKQATIKYYDNYKKLDKLANRKKLITESLCLPSIGGVWEDDPPIGALQKTQKLGLLPCCMGLVKGNGDPSILNIKGQKFGDKYIQAISSGLKQAKLVQKCQLSNNRITDQGFNNLLSNIGNQITRLDVSMNKISRIDQKLLNIVLQPQARLEYLNLQGNMITDTHAQNLFRSSSYSKHLKYLNMRNNVLTQQSAESISELLNRTCNLEELYIGMNRIYDEGAIKIINSLEKNRTVKVFDYGMNKLGQFGNSCAKNIANLLVNNKVLLHVDFSSNNFSLQESKVIGEALQKNKKIYGFHFSGNNGYIDSKGFLKFQEKNLTSLHSIVHKNINSYDIVFPRQNTSFQANKFKNVCWICEGWYEQVFKFNIPQPNLDGKNLVYIHFDFEEYEPRLINLTDTHVKYKTMVPPKKYKYFFTWNKEQYLDQMHGQSESRIPSRNKIGLRHQNIHRNHQHQPKTVKIDIPQTYQYQMDHQIITFEVKNATMRAGKPKKIVDNWDELIVSVIPRQIGLVTKKQKKPWEYKDSLWAKQWKLDDDQLMRNCFEKDWKNSKLMNLIKNQAEQDKVKELLYQHYRLIKEIYRHYSSWNPFNGDIWAISNNAFTEFCHEAKIISKDTPLKIIDLTFITTNSMSGADWKGNSLVPERGLIRFQFMESIVRLAEEKFKKNGYCDSILASVSSLLKDHIAPLQQNPIFCSEKWRLKKYFIEENDMLLKKYRPIFTQIYKKNSRMKVKPGNKPFMCLAEFKSIIQRIGIAGSLVLERDQFLSSNCSMMTQIDEIQNERFMRMTQIQFIEAIARCAFILPDSCKIQQVFQGSTPFYGKFEWIIHQLKNLCSDDIKNQYPGGQSLFGQSQDDDSD